MIESVAVEAIFQRWLDVWPGLQPTVPFSFDNETAITSDQFARVTIIDALEEQGSMGQHPTFERRGNIFVSLFSPANQGRKPMALLVDSVRTVYRNQMIGATGHSDTVWTFGSSSRPSPTDGRWYMQSVVTPFLYFDSPP